MTVLCLPFDAQNVSEAQWHSYVQVPIGQGVIQGALNELRAFGDSSGMQIKVTSGEARILGAWLQSSAQDTYSIGANASGVTRFDRLVMRLNFSTNTGTITIKQGSGGTPPAMQRDTTVWEMSLAKVTVINGASNIALGDVTDERGDPTVCGWASSKYPIQLIDSAAQRPTTCAIGTMVYQRDTGLIYVNTGTFAAPVWTRSGPTVFASPLITLGTTPVVGTREEFIHSDAGIVAFDVTAPSTQAMGDSAVVGVINFAARRDHKHAMPAFGTPAVVLGTAAAPGAAVTAMRTDATILAFDATVPTTSAPSDAAAAGAAAVAARRDHVHGREGSPHLFAYKVSSQQVTSSTVLVNDADLFIAIPAGTVWAFEFYLIVHADSDTPDIKLVIGADSASGTVTSYLDTLDLASGAIVPVTPQFMTTLAQPPVVIPLYLLGGPVPARIQGTYRNTGGATTLRLKWAQNASNASAVYVDTGSHLIAHRMA